MRLAITKALPYRTRACGAFVSGARSYRGGAGFGVLALEQAAIVEQRAIRRQLQAVAANR